METNVLHNYVKVADTTQKVPLYGMIGLQVCNEYLETEVEISWCNSCGTIKLHYNNHNNDLFMGIGINYGFQTETEPECKAFDKLGPEVLRLVRKYVALKDKNND